MNLLPPLFVLIKRGWLMERFRYSFLVALVSVLLISSTASAFRHVEEWDRSFSVSSNVRVELSNRNGSFRITGWDRDEIEIRAKIRIKAPSKNKALKLADALKFEIDNSHDRFTLEVKYPKTRSVKLFSFFGDNVSIKVSFDIKVPRNCSIEVDNVNGFIALMDTRSEIDLETVNGSISIDGLILAGRAKTVNGAINCTMRDVVDSGRLTLKGINGSIKLFVPEGADIELDAKTINGAVKLRMPAKRFVSKRNRVKAICGEGSFKIELREINGSITVRPIQQAI